MQSSARAVVQNTANKEGSVMNLSLLRLCAVIGLSIGALALPTTAFAGGGPTCVGPGPSGQVMSCHFTGLDAQASFQANSADGTETSVSIFATDGRSLDAGTGPSSVASSVDISINKWMSDPSNPKGGTELVSLFGEVSNPSGLQINPSLESASLTSVQVLVSGFDENGTVANTPVTLNVSWTGTGAVIRSSGSFTYRSGGFVYAERFRGDVRSATPTGSAIEGSSDLLAGLSPLYADLQSNSDATLNVSHS